MTFSTFLRDMVLCRLHKLTRWVSHNRLKSTASTCDGCGVQLAYASYVPPSGVTSKPPVIFIHGLFGGKNNLARLSKAMSKTRKVVAVDCRNHGDSPHTPDMSFPLMAMDLELLFSHLSIPHAIVVGHSMGGKVAMTLALTKPHLVSKLVVEDVSPDVTRTAQMTDFPKYLRAMSDVTFDHSVTQYAMRRLAAKQLEEAFPEKGLRDFVVTNIVQHDNRYIWQVNIAAILANLDQVVGFPDLNCSYTGPTLFLGGSRSAQITEKNRPEILRFFPRAEIRHIEGADHWVHAEKPQEVLAAITQFADHAHS